MMELVPPYPSLTFELTFVFSLFSFTMTLVLQRRPCRFGSVIMIPFPLDGGWFIWV